MSASAPVLEPVPAPSQPGTTPTPPSPGKRRITWRAVRRTGLWALLIAAIAAGGFATYRLRAAKAEGDLPVAPVRKGDFLVVVRARGELKARTSVQVTAPVNVPELRIVWLASQGGAIKAGDPIVRFDPSSARNQLNEKKAALQQAQAALDQAIAQANIQLEQDKLDLAAADHQVERAKLEVSKAEIVSALQAEESRVDLSMAEKKLSVQAAAGQLNTASNKAKIASLERARDKAKEEVDLTQYRLDQMELKAPIDGMVHFLPNYSNGWMNAKPFKVGDQAWPGGAVAEIPALETLEMEGKLDEIDRGRIAEGRDVRVRIDSLPESTFPAKLAQISPMTVMGWEWPPTRTFRGFAKLEKIDPRLRPSMNGSMDIVIDRIPNAISIPSKALFTKGGKPVVYTPENGQYKAIEVEVLARNPDEVAVKGLGEGAKVTLLEPETKKGKV